MIWNYRLIRSKDLSFPGEFHYAIHEVFYDENNKESGCTANPATVCESSPEEVQKTLEWMLKAVVKYPVLNIELFTELAKNANPTR